MIKQELIDDIKKSIPEIVNIVGNDFPWYRVAEMVENGGHMHKIHESNDDYTEEDLNIECAYISYAIERNLPLHKCKKKKKHLC